MKSCVLWLVAYAAVAVAGYTIFQGKVSESQRPSQLVNARSDESEVLPVTRKDGFEVLRRYHRQSGSRTSTSSAPFVLLYAISLAGKPELSARRACLQDSPFGQESRRARTGRSVSSLSCRPLRKLPSDRRELLSRRD